MNISLHHTLREVEDIERVEFFNVLHSIFQQAVQAVGAIDRDYRIGGFTIRLRFAGDALIPRITPALNHLATETSAPPDLTICLWDQTSTGIRMPFLIRMLLQALCISCIGFVDSRQGVLKGLNSERMRAAFYPGPNILSLLDLQQHLALYWVNAASQVFWFETGSPLRTILNWWMVPQQRQFIHAGAVGTARGGALLAGKGGSGKTTTALACLQSELLYVGDDYCIAATEPVPYVYSIYNTAKLKGTEDLARFPELVRYLYNPDRVGDEKAMLFLHDHFPEKVVSGLPLKVILIPHVTGRAETTCKPASSGLALRVIAPSTIAQLPGAGQATMQTMAKLVRQLPCYILEVGTDLTQIPEVILRVLEENDRGKNYRNFT